MLRDGRRDLDHLQERDRPLLHPGPPRRRCSEQREPLLCGSLDGADETSGGRHADRPAEEAELASQNGDAATGDPSLAGGDSLV